MRLTLVALAAAGAAGDFLFRVFLAYASSESGDASQLQLTLSAFALGDVSEAHVSWDAAADGSHFGCE